MDPFSCLFLAFFQTVIFENVSAAGILHRTDYFSECNFQDDFILKRNEFAIWQRRICTDRKSARIDAKGLAVTFVAMANADGGYLGIGIEDDGTITGIDAYEKNINEIQRIPYDYCVPSI